MINLNVNRVEAIRDDIERGDGLIEFDVEILAIGGGGAGGTVSFYGGGGAGGFISASWIAPPKTTFDVQIGSGSQDTLITLASDSSVVFRANAGGDGQDGDGENGGSGGAGGGGAGDTGGLSVSPTIPNRATLAYATGSDGGRGNNAANNGGGGGGVNSAGADATPGSPGAGGAWIPITDTFVNGLVSGVTILAGGGDGATNTAGPALPYAANSGHGGDGGSSNTQGSSGLFAIKYEGLPKATGGTITQSGGYTTHVFTGSAQLITTGKSNNNP